MSSTTHERKIPQGKMWKRILNEKFNPQLAIIMAFFLKLGHFLPIFQKGQGRPSPPPPSSYAPDSWNIALNSWFILSKLQLLVIVFFALGKGTVVCQNNGVLLLGFFVFSFRSFCVLLRLFLVLCILFYLACCVICHNYSGILIDNVNDRYKNYRRVTDESETSTGDYRRVQMTLQTNHKRQ